ncbi:MAG: hypothetical protein E7474_10385 [Ruminococcaceae bacterium]|nr:hypothetical protein [Oscillospiraceae bacterium]
MSLFAACALTVLLETPLFFLAGYRSRDEITVVVCANVVTNLLLNLTAAYLLQGRLTIAYSLELAVVAAEYAAYALAFGRSKRLFLLTLAANCLSFGVGLLL